MTRDFKQSETGNSAPNQYGLSWVLGGIAVGLLAGGVVYALMSNQQQTNVPVQSADSVQSAPATGNTVPVTANTTAPTLQDTPRDDPRPGFSYHAVLPQLELDVPIPPPQETAPADLEPIVEPEVEQIEQEATVATEQAIEQTMPKGRYMFQLGAYQNQGQAQQMQQRARQNGMNTRIEPAADLETAFANEMSRFLPPEIAKNTVEAEGFFSYVQQTVGNACQSVLSSENQGFRM